FPSRNDSVVPDGIRPDDQAVNSAGSTGTRTSDTLDHTGRGSNDLELTRQQRTPIQPELDQWAQTSNLGLADGAAPYESTSMTDSLRGKVKDHTVQEHERMESLLVAGNSMSVDEKGDGMMDSDSAVEGDPVFSGSGRSGNAMTPILSGRYVGSLFNTYIIIEGKDCFYLIDQHAAHEKINFTRIMETYRNSKIITQPLLSPEVIDLSPSAVSVAESERSFIESLGFEFEPFGQNAVVIRAFPVVTSTLSPRLAFTALIDQLEQISTAVISELEEDQVYDLLADMACKASVKAHDRLSEAEVQTLLEQMSRTDQPWHCPHGRPVVLVFTAYELEKLFKRVIS
ncbi:MAG TPA: hypothetical protein GX717_08265, partial [Clostridiaceae bacterium]|nr:hypothetical protein [Clostridiaceae bacterium]